MVKRPRAMGRRLTAKQAAINLARQAKESIPPRRFAVQVTSVTDRETTGTVTCTGIISGTVQVRANVDLAADDWIWVREDPGAQDTYVFDGFVKGGGTGNNAADAPIPWTQSPGITSPAGADLTITAVSGQTTIIGSTGDTVQFDGDVDLDLDELNDVNAGSPNDNDCLVWNNGTSEWQNDELWPFADKELTVGPDARYATLALAAAAASSGDCIRVGAGVHVISNDIVPVGIDLRGSGKGVTILRCTDHAVALQLAGSNNVSDLTVENNYDAGATTYAIYTTGADIDARDVRAASNNPSGNSVGWALTSTTVNLVNCEGYATGGGWHIALYTLNSGSGDVEVEGGSYDGDSDDINAGILGDVITLNDPLLINGTIQTLMVNGTVQGSWRDTSGNQHFVDEYVAANAHAFKVKNTSGGTVTLGDVGYIDEAGEYKETTTEHDDVTWCVVAVGGANNADIYVARRGRVTITLDQNCSAGDYLYTSTTAGQATTETYVRPELFAVALTANTSGAGGTCTALLLCNRATKPLHSDNDVLYIQSASTSDWKTTQNGAPAGAVITYNVALTNGSEDTIVPTAATELGKLVLHNTTRGEEAFISSVNTGANTITVSDADDVSAWVDTNVLEVRSQTNTTNLAAAYYFDVEITSSEVPALAVALHMYWDIKDTGGAGQNAIIHPYEADSPSKRFLHLTQVANVAFRGYCLTSLINRRFVILWLASGASTFTYYLKMMEIVIAEP